MTNIWVEEFSTDNTEDELLNQNWTIEKSNVDINDFPGGVNVTGVSGGASSYLFSMRRPFHFSFFPVTNGSGLVSKVAWQEINGPISPLTEPGQYRTFVALSRTSDYLTGNQAFYYQDTLFATLRVASFSYDNTSYGATVYTAAGGGSRRCLLWHEGGAWHFGNTASSLTGSSQILDPNNYTLVTSATLPNPIYKYVTFRNDMSTPITTNRLAANYLYVYVEYEPTTTTPESGGGFDYYNPSVTGTTGTQSSRFAPPRTR